MTAERENFEKLIAQAKNIPREEIVLSSAPFFQLSEKEGKLLITGIALAEGVWKNVLYPADQIEKSANALVGKPLVVEHGMNENFQRRQVGKVLSSTYDSALKSLVFQAEVTDPEAIKCVKDGTFPAVSCSTWIDKYPVNDEQSIGFNFLFNELSLCRTPACEKCFIFAVEELSKKIQKEKEDQSQLITGEKKMKEEDKTNVEEEIELSELEPPKLFAVIEVQSLSELEEFGKKVTSYYYGYRYPYEKKAKYPYPKYPNYPYHPYYAEKTSQKNTDLDQKALWAVLELSSPTEISDLKKAGKKIAAVYYGYYGYPYQGRESPGKYEPDKYEDQEPKQGLFEDLSEESLEELLTQLDLAVDYKAFMKKCLKTNPEKNIIKRMKACAKAYNESKKEAGKEKPKEMPKEAYPSKEEKSTEITDYSGTKTPLTEPNPLVIVTIPKPLEVQATEMKLSAETVKKEEAPAVEQKVTLPMSEEPCKDCPKKEEPKVETPPVEVAKTEPPKEEPKKVEPPKTETPAVVEVPKVEPSKVEEPKVEPPKVEPPKEVPKVEPPKVELPKEEPKVEPKPEPVKEPKVETPKEEPKEEPKPEEPSPEEVRKFLKEHWPETFLKKKK